eukprot:CAMPEP_0197942026 /NCGR_PEP_ID=MMETSP1439-20131203/123734_1 /TAXON_ID=66791 /ORGANISM="Gonyaulax spinifera, Strain CCMP409" /LENGTH=72 /DNA_ID=CAMNT_0043565263 /DNA_START=25 /DNA_END=240 /DNA_ORIENTATION=-
MSCCRPEESRPLRILEHRQADEQVVSSRKTRDDKKGRTGTAHGPIAQSPQGAARDIQCHEDWGIQLEMEADI